jgi:hypothetical protein
MIIKNKRLLRVGFLLSMLLLSKFVTAGLIERGNGMLYDTVFDITWMNDFSNVSSNIYAEGLDNLNSNKFGGFDDWRLVKLPDHMNGCVTPFYMEYQGLDCVEPIVPQSVSLDDGRYLDMVDGTGFAFSFLILEYSNGLDSKLLTFSNPNSTKFISTMDYDLNGLTSLTIRDDSFYNINLLDYRNLRAWAVRDGDVAVPESSSIIIFSFGLISLVVRKRKIN